MAQGRRRSSAILSVRVVSPIHLNARDSHVDLQRSPNMPTRLVVTGPRRPPIAGRRRPVDAPCLGARRGTYSVLRHATAFVRQPGSDRGRDRAGSSSAILSRLGTYGPAGGIRVTFTAGCDPSLRLTLRFAILGMPLHERRSSSSGCTGTTVEIAAHLVAAGLRCQCCRRRSRRPFLCPLPPLLRLSSAQPKLQSSKGGLSRVRKEMRTAWNCIEGYYSCRSHDASRPSCSFSAATEFQSVISEVIALSIYRLRSHAPSLQANSRWATRMPTGEVLRACSVAVLQNSSRRVLPCHHPAGRLSDACTARNEGGPSSLACVR
ncbi:hypothetical protein OH77DRAFT_508037 [Trametes cingulata]|nr:hypothetical protein OH77DRAFT_508037 [Trametes cingulata]